MERKNIDVFTNLNFNYIENQLSKDQKLSNITADENKVISNQPTINKDKLTAKIPINQWNKVETKNQGTLQEGRKSHRNREIKEDKNQKQN